ncbi:MAG: hypothetical protein Q7S20_01205 [Gemmatimonadaceae bacterium]|nr:hypothetical protein [Gemmatimonadaceae bacterium]
MSDERNAGVFVAEMITAVSMAVSGACAFSGRAPDVAVERAADRTKAKALVVADDIAVAGMVG